MKAILLSLCFLTVNAFAILPLPYPTEAIEESNLAGQELAKDIEKDPKSVEGYLELYSGGKTREMEMPTFDAQPSAVGYKVDETFRVPPQLKARVDFWKRIYTEVTSYQALLHDSLYPEITYQVVDLRPYANDASLSYRKRMKHVQRILKAEKEKITDQLKFLHANQDNPMKIPKESFALFKQFESLSGPNKFLDAADRVRAQIGQRDRIVQGFLYAGRYVNQMMTIFEKKGVPKELTRLPLVESAFNLGARSKVGASGVWQFMRSTGKRFLRIDRAIDERNDPLTAAWAAAELLKQNYAALGSWPLAITAYNHGREGMAQAVRQLSTTDLPDIIRRYRGPTFGFASSNFFSEFLAILEVEREYRTHFGKLLVDAPIAFEEFNVVDNVKFADLAAACRTPERELAALNPALTEWVLSGRGFIPQGYMLKIPPGHAEKCRSGYRNVRHVPKAQQVQLASLGREPAQRGARSLKRGIAKKAHFARLVRRGAKRGHKRSAIARG